jgi:peptidyl-prolyl cis-trans isomerase A (cyclophilin A)
MPKTWNGPTGSVSEHWSGWALHTRSLAALILPRQALQWDVHVETKRKHMLVLNSIFLPKSDPSGSPLGARRGGMGCELGRAFLALGAAMALGTGPASAQDGGASVSAASASAPIAASAPAAVAKPMPRVKLHTSEGAIVIELRPDLAPKTVANFVQYVKAGFYNGLIFHRVIDDFMIQTGGYTADLTPRPTRPPIVLESRNGLSNDRGSVAMARQAAPHTANSQFFINVRDNLGLNAEFAPDGQGYAVFGRVVQGMEVVDAIKVRPTRRQSVFEALPEQTILIKKATLEKDHGPAN